MAQLIGRLNHIAFVIPKARHFMSRLRRLEQSTNKRRTVRITNEAKKDSHLWLSFLLRAKDRISLNNIVFKKPTFRGLSEACKTGMGGYGKFTGLTWHHQF